MVKNMKKALEAALTVQKNYEAVMEPWIRQQEMVECMLTPVSNIINPMGDFTTQIQESLMRRTKWVESMVHTGEAVQSAQYIFEQQASAIHTLEYAMKTPELLGLQIQLNNNNLCATNEYIKNLTSDWITARSACDCALESSIAAQNIAFLRLVPDYKELTLPRGGKKAITGLTKKAAHRMLQTDELLFDTKSGHYFLKENPDNKVTADQISVIDSSLDIFASITLSELIDFESELYEDITFAIEHPVGRRIYEIIKNWNSFIDFDKESFYHARAQENGRCYLRQEMLKAPRNVPGHGRYNAIGKSCYYFTETLEGAVSEIRKHSGNKRPYIQVAEIKPRRSIKMLDLSAEVSKDNKFIEHMRYAVDNDDAKIKTAYLLPNFVASCCKKLGIQGIKYKSNQYASYVTWEDDYFDFVRYEIIKPKEN